MLLELVRMLAPDGDEEEEPYLEAGVEESLGMSRWRPGADDPEPADLGAEDILPADSSSGDEAGGAFPREENDEEEDADSDSSAPSAPPTPPAAPAAPPVPLQHGLAPLPPAAPAVPQALRLPGAEAPRRGQFPTMGVKIEHRGYTHTVRFDFPGLNFVAQCGKHGPQCRQHRRSLAGRKKGSGRPIGYLVGWLFKCDLFDGPNAGQLHVHDKRKIPSFFERVAARDVFSRLPGAQAFLELESAHEEGEPEEFDP